LRMLSNHSRLPPNLRDLSLGQSLYLLLLLLLLQLCNVLLSHLNGHICEVSSANARKDHGDHIWWNTTCYRISQYVAFHPPDLKPNSLLPRLLFLLSPPIIFRLCL